MSTLFEVEGLCASYGKIAALRDVSVKVERGVVVSVVGPNGAGKTTMLNALMGLMPAAGSVRLDGRRIDHLPAEARLEAGICLVAEARELFGSMTVEDNLRLGGFVRRGEGRAAMNAALDAIYHRFPRLRERRTQLAGTLSGGERQMLAIGRALMSKPRILMLDEPSLGLAPLIVREMFHIITDLKSADVAILLVEQNARAALTVSEHAYVLELGQVALQGPSGELSQDKRVIETYIGADPRLSGDGPSRIQ